jgi:hypothetical protein
MEDADPESAEPERGLPVQFQDSASILIGDL